MEVRIRNLGDTQTIESVPLQERVSASRPFDLVPAGAEGTTTPNNPLLEPAQIRDIMISAKAKVLVALGEHPGSEIWPKVEAIRREVPTLEAVIRVMGPSDESQG